MPIQPFAEFYGRKSAMISLLGKRFGRLTVVSLDHGGDAPRWHCKCECGQTKSINGASLRRGLTKSCGCLSREMAAARNKLLITTHGASKTPEYKVWQGIHQRCRNPNDKDFAKYGGRGIRVCSRWHAFEAFIEDMGPRPRGHSIDRINVNGGYSPSNCRWATTKQQNNNKRNTLKVFARGALVPLSSVVASTHSAEYQRLRKLAKRQ